MCLFKVTTEGDEGSETTVIDIPHAANPTSVHESKQ